MTVKQRKEFVEALARDNRAFYGTLDGRAVLRAFELTFEHPWIYVFELVQNALDADARTIAFRLSEDGDALIFQHDGNAPLEKQEVIGLSKIFRSTKGAASVGFMGIGFKSVFGRFREARISGWGWTFRYQISQSVGEEYGDVQADPLGAVTPLWDERLDEPDEGFTTRFELRTRLDRSASLQSDLSRFLSVEDLTPLAILAESKLEHLDVDGSVWDLSVERGAEGYMTATARSGRTARRWQLFSVEFQPTRTAIRCFLEHRKIRPAESEREQVYKQASRARRVLGVLPLNDRRVPVPPERGRIYATLPTEVTCALGIHVNADWLLNISRTGLGEVEENAWQREIVDRIANILRCLLAWVARTFTEPDAINAAFAVLASPSSAAGGPEAILSKEHWKSRLHDMLRDAAVFPAWTEPSLAIGFVKPSEVIVPPDPLADAFEEQEALRPAGLLNGPVLARKVIGSRAIAMLRRIGFLSEMTPAHLKRTWAGGLESWWKELDAEETVRRDMLFRVWGALSMLTPEDDWETADLLCVRTVGDRWQSARESAYLGEPLPSDSEPGGSETRGFISPFAPASHHRLADDWIRALQRPPRGRPQSEEQHLLQARGWIERHARGIGLREIVQSAVDGLMASPTPDWVVLIPLGRWSMHRNRPDLVTHVLAESEHGERKGVAVNDALLADPYVRPEEAGRSRRLLFASVPTVCADYLAGEATADAHEWRTFLEKAGAHGAPRVRVVENRASRWDKQSVQEFLGLSTVEDSTRGYTLQDFDIDPVLPARDSSPEMRLAVAGWLDDSHGPLRGRGRRQVIYFYYSEGIVRGTRLSVWVDKLCKLAWVPCDDGELRRPQDVLSQPDPARENAPIAKLSRDLVSILERESVSFGSHIPKATTLYRIVNTGSKITAEEFTDLLRDVRDELETSDERSLLAEAIANAVVPIDDNERVPLRRVVRRIGGQLRGSLAGWAVPLDRFKEDLRGELEHPDLPYEIPDTTTGYQALDYIIDVWERARSSPEGLANEVRDVLPSAYAYCLDDCADDLLLAKRWEDAVPRAVVFAEREWVDLAGDDNVHFADIEDRRFVVETPALRTATSGHLGRSMSEQRRTATELRLPLLSASVAMEWSGELQMAPNDDWIKRFDVICGVLRSVRGIDGVDTDPSVPKTVLRISPELAVKVRIGGAPAEHVPVNARLHDGVLTVRGRPVEFGADAAKELLRDNSLRQRGDLAADLTGMLMAIDARDDFDLAVDKFRRAFARDFDLSMPAAGTANEDGLVWEAEESRSKRVIAIPTTTNSEAEDNRNKVEEHSLELDHSTSDESNEMQVTVDDKRDEHHTKERDEPGSSSFSKDRSLATQRRLAKELKESLKAEIAPSEDEHDVDETQDRTVDVDESPGDEVYRRVAAQYERDSGREPECGDPYQEGWDLRSVDPSTGTKRLIEVKGKGCLWDNDEVVELTRAQVRKAFEVSRGEDAGLWYLYVVERMDDASYRVLPIENPVDVAGKWILCGGSWRMIAEEPRQITIE